MAEFKALTLSQATAFDKAANHPPTRWGVICAERAKSGNTRRARVLRNIASGKTTGDKRGGKK